jgi:hypothetical protein
MGFTFGVIAEYFIIAYGFAAAVIVLPFLSFRRSIRQASGRLRGLYKIGYLAVVFGLAGIVASGVNTSFRSGGWYGIAIFAAFCATVFLHIVKPEKSERGSGSGIDRR